MQLSKLLVVVVFVATGALSLQSAQASPLDYCESIEKIGRGAGIFEMLLDAAFTIPAIAAGSKGPSSDLAAAELGVMIPQALLNIIGTRVYAPSSDCSDTPAFVMQVIPLGWSLALVGHGIWGLTKSPAYAPSPSAAPLVPPPGRISIMPAALGPRAFGISLQGRF